jgi:hypothetical protein
MNQLHKPLLSERVVPLEILGVTTDGHKLALEALLERFVFEGPPAPLAIVSGAALGVADHDPQKDGALESLCFVACLHQFGAPAHGAPFFLKGARQDELKATL